jgi:hypothetical protein
VSDGRELKYRTKKVDYEGILENSIPTFGPPCIIVRTLYEVGLQNALSLFYT